MKLFRLTSLLLLLGLVGPLYAEEADVVVDIDRDGMALRAELDVRPDDRDTTDTAIIASNTSDRPARVICFRVRCPTVNRPGHCRYACAW